MTNEEAAKELITRLRILDSDHKPQHLHLVALKYLQEAEARGKLRGLIAARKIAREEESEDSPVFQRIADLCRKVKSGLAGGEKP